MWTNLYLDSVSKYAQAIGPDKIILVPPTSTLTTSSTTHLKEYPHNIKSSSNLDYSLQMIAMAKDRGLHVHPFVYRVDRDIEPQFQNNYETEQVS